MRRSMSLTVADVEVDPAVVAPLDTGFLPASLFNRKYREMIAASGGTPLELALERADGSVSTFSSTVLPPEAGLEGVNDSKKLSPGRRRELYGIIIDTALSVATGSVEPGEIDEFGMSESVRLSFTRAESGLDVRPDITLIGGLPVKSLVGPGRMFFVRGDSRSLSIAAASIVAKVVRDGIMIKADSIYPGYGFARNKGYGTPAHFRALEHLGPSPIHRMSFSPLREDSQPDLGLFR
jgi:ribonuclease HII